jgi:hypothetical protein
LSASEAHSKAQQDARSGSSASAKLRAAETPGDETKKELKAVATKLIALCSPWPLWNISGCWITGGSDLPTNGAITATDAIGKEILSYVPLSLVADFLSKKGQTIVSSSNFLFISSAKDQSTPGQLHHGYRSGISRQSTPDQRSPDLHEPWV